MEHTWLIVSGGHLINSLKKTTSTSELIDLINELVIKGDLIQITRQEDTFNDGKIYLKHYFRLTERGKSRLKPLYVKAPAKLWDFLKSDAYVFLSIISAILSIVSITLTISSRLENKTPVQPHNLKNAKMMRSPGTLNKMPNPHSTISPS